jgi:hypothetical protein
MGRRNWRTAKALTTLLSQIDELAPDRKKDWDGTIASENHHLQNPTSDHEAMDIGDGNGPIVKAMDITHDPENGIDSYKLADWLLKAQDERIKYVISNGRISSGTDQKGLPPWKWRKYPGSNKHDHHVHISVKQAKRHYDNTKPWDLSGFNAKPKSAPEPEVKRVVSEDVRLRQAKIILDYEARRDHKGRLAVYPLPYDDFGGTYEVAGINDRYHPREAAELAALIRAGKYNTAEKRAIEIIEEYTDPVAGWDDRPAVQFILRDCYFNRGPGGVAKILQRALGININSVIGPATREALHKTGDEKSFLNDMRSAREWYERTYAHRNEKSRYWRGLVNRWDNANRDARIFVV